jgi:hypothetical protein
MSAKFAIVEMDTANIRFLELELPTSARISVALRAIFSPRHSSLVTDCGDWDKKIRPFEY